MILKYIKKSTIGADGYICRGRGKLGSAYDTAELLEKMVAFDAIMMAKPVILILYA
jgi:hypothetical protein